MVKKRGETEKVSVEEYRRIAGIAPPPARSPDPVKAAMSTEEYREATRQAVPKRSKYGAIKTTVDGVLFDSKKEATRYSELKLREKAGEISHLVLQPKFPIKINGHVVASYSADFAYVDERIGRRVIEDVKSPITRKKEAYRLKKKIVEALYEITIEEV